MNFLNKLLSSFLAIFFIGTIGLYAQPANDLCSDAISITAPGTPGTTNFSGSGSTLTATTTDYPPSCGSGVDNSSIGGIWYTFDGEASTLYSISTCDVETDFDTEISIHTITGTGSCMTSLACQAGNDDDASCGPDYNRSTLSIFVPAGIMPTTYYVYVKGNGTATGTLKVGVTNGPPLPVELISFKGKVQERSNKLTWETASEVNTERHILERSFNGSSDWVYVGDREANGFSSEIQRYELEDNNPLAKAYYRLRSVDFDGQENLSEVVYLERRTETFDVLNITPNPAQDFVMINYNQVKNSPVTFTLMNLQGQIIRQWSSDSIQGIQQERLDLSAFSKGMYFIRLNNGIKSISKRILRS